MAQNELDEDPLVGRTIDKYEIARVVGQGGMGTVYEAFNPSVGKRVAIKVIDRELARSQDSIARFQREAQAAGAVESAHIIDVVDAGTTDDGLPFLVMELLRGEDLGHRLRRLGRLELTETLVIAGQILRGLARAHDAGIVHRDLKPDNVFLLDRDDDATFVKILDFGISKIERRAGVPTKTLTREGMVLGTPYYMAPEQAQGLPEVDARADLWSLGAILYECLTGRPPYTGGTYEQVIVRLCSHEADDVRALAPSVPEPVARVISTALQRSPELRYANARAFLDALAEASGGVVSSRRREGTPTPSGRVAIEQSPAAAAVGLTSTITEPGGPRSTKAERARARRRSYVLVASASLTVGAALALVYARGDQARGAAQPSAIVAPTGSSAPGSSPRARSIGLTANAPSARYVVDGRALAQPTLDGELGQRRRVRVEAEGYAPLEADIVFDGLASERRFELVPAPPSSAPSAASSAISAPPRSSDPRPPRAADGPKPALSIRRE